MNGAMISVPCLLLGFLFLEYLNVKAFREYKHLGPVDTSAWKYNSNPIDSFIRDWKWERAGSFKVSYPSTDYPSSEKLSKRSKRFQRKYASKIVLVDIYNDFVYSDLDFISTLTALEDILIRTQGEPKKPILDAIQSRNLKSVAILTGPLADDTLRELAERYPNLESLGLYFHSPQDLKASAFEPLKKLTHLNLHDVRIRESHLKVFQQMRDLESLFFNSETTPPEKLNEFYQTARFPVLKTLQVNDLTGQQIKYFPQFAPNLESISTWEELSQKDKAYLKSRYTKGIRFDRAAQLKI